MSDQSEIIISRNPDPRLGFMLGRASRDGRSPGEHVGNVFSEADARLFKAAPKMLAALNDAYSELAADSSRDGPRCLLLTQIEAAIAAAEGGEG
jgi:hypothetical protein